jgi:tetratricopeptide (TPR) repeat protein
MGEKVLALTLLIALLATQLTGAESRNGSGTPTLDSDALANAAHWRQRQEDAFTRVSANANDATAWSDLAEAALMQGDGATAASALEQATTLRPDDPRGRFLSGCLALKERRHDDARVAFARAVELDPSFVDARFFLGRACRYLGRLDEALEHFAAVLVARPEQVSARTYRIRVLQDLGRSGERDAEIAALYTLRRTGHNAALNRATAFRRDRIVVPGGAAVVLERFAGEPLLWRAITAAGGVRRELVVCRDHAGWMLAAVSVDGARCVSRWQALPAYDDVRPRLADLLAAPWPPAGEPVTLALDNDSDLDAGL